MSPVLVAVLFWLLSSVFIKAPQFWLAELLVLLFLARQCRPDFPKSFVLTVQGLSLIGFSFSFGFSPTASLLASAAAAFIFWLFIKFPSSASLQLFSWFLFLVSLWWLKQEFNLATLLVVTFFVLGFVFFSLALESWRQGVAELNKKTRRRVFILALLNAEFIWAVNYLPFNFLTQAGLSFLFSFLLWEYARASFESAGQSPLSKLKPELALILTAAALILAVSRWLP